MVYIMVPYFRMKSDKCAPNVSIVVHRVHYEILSSMNSLLLIMMFYATILFLDLINIFALPCYRLFDDRAK
jgi:hypothetical protein